MSTEPVTVKSKGASPPEAQSDELCRELVERVVRSSILARSKRLASFLVYVCEEALGGRAGEINEQRVGEAVFGRPPDYDPAVDGIVRTQASRLRQRLDEYFRNDGADEPIRIVIPRGGYAPAFEVNPRSNRNKHLEESSLVSAANESTSRTLLGSVPATESKPHRPPVVAWALVVVLAFTSVYYWRKAASMSPTSPAAHLLWRNIFLPGKKALVVSGDSGLVLWEGLMKRNLSLAEFLKGDYRNAAAASDPTEQVASALSKRRYTSVVDLEMVHWLTQIADSEMSGIELRYARDARPNDVRDNNAILLGSPEANPWLDLFEPNMDFAFRNDHRRVFSIVNRRPRGQEPAEWISMGPPEDVVYAIIAYLPGLNQRRHALIVAGTAMAGTECALNFLSDDRLFTPFLEKIRRSDGTLRHFEVVLGTHSMAGSALKPSVFAWRTID